jgi:probable rRNA maturation factor
VTATRHGRGHTRLALEIGGTTGWQHHAFLRKNLTAAHRIIRPALERLSVALVGTRTMARLHQQFLGVAGPTDVLSFVIEQRGRRAIGGEIVICTAVAARQAARRKIPTRLELLLYALHGMLHLCGHDDQTSRQYQAMHRLEDQILTRLGHGPAFALPQAAGPRGARRRRPKGTSR